MFYQPDMSGFQERLPGIFMKVLSYGDNSMLCEFHLKQGAVIPAHQHLQEQTGYMVSGSLRFFGEVGEMVVVAGSSWSFKGGIMHGAEVLVDSVVIEVFSPVREDYLP